MTKRTFKKGLLISGGVFMFLVAVLCVHIYIVTRPKPMDATAIAMARIDIKQPIDQADATKITTWLYQQKGIDHVLCNPKSDIVIFTFHPAQVNANSIVSNFQTELSYKAERYMPSAEEMSAGCPVMANTVTGKVYNFFRHI